MENIIESNVEARKEWAAPELKKVDIEQITAAGSLFFDEAGHNGTGNS
jgi:hypothetical protein